MKILLVHNSYGKFSGEEAVVADHVALLEEQGHEVCRFTRSSAELTGLLGFIKGFCAGLGNPFMKTAFRKSLADASPDVVHIHNLYPLISPLILPECTRAGIPVVMTVHNVRLVCPNGLFFSHGQICEQCTSTPIKEWNCLLKNCEGSYAKSGGYALRSWLARMRRQYLDHVSLFCCLTEFHRRKLCEVGIPEDRTCMIPNCIQVSQADSLNHEETPDQKHNNQDKEAETNRNGKGNYVIYAGRLSHEKGIDLILEAAKSLPHIPFKLAGSGEEVYKVDAPENVEFLGFVDKAVLPKMYREARLCVMASRCYEGFPTSLPEAMLQETPTIVPNHGGMPEIVGNKNLVFEPGNARALADRIEELWENPHRCAELGWTARTRVLENYTTDVVYPLLMNAYEKAKGLANTSKC
jgi:glycosyltransferase involved in cell wall biosynthesis